MKDKTQSGLISNRPLQHEAEPASHHSTLTLVLVVCDELLNMPSRITYSFGVVLISSDSLER